MHVKVRRRFRGLRHELSKAWQPFSAVISCCPSTLMRPWKLWMRNSYTITQQGGKIEVQGLLGWTPPGVAPPRHTAVVQDSAIFRSWAGPTYKRSSPLALLPADLHRRGGVLRGSLPEYPASPPSHLFAILPYSRVHRLGKGILYCLGKATEHAVCRPSNVALGSPRIMPVTHLTHAL